MTDTLLAFENASFGYADNLVLTEVEFELAAGVVVGVLGANGSGKTTLVRGATRVLDAVGGDVSVAGRAVRDMDRRDIARAIAVVPQDRPPVFQYTVLETVLMGRTPWMRPFSFEGDDDVAIALSALRAVGLEDRSHRTLLELSGGERQRVIVARALAQQTRVLLADEPTAHLDLRHAVEIFALFRRLAQERGLAVMLITHDLNLAAASCDRVVLLAGGKILAQGSADEVLRAELLSEAFSTQIDVTRNVGGALVIVPHPAQ